jgi:2-polyprenyl-3-methyl-5-hydroxy-6-metoxy-1,4-benzoquinol methylase
MLISSNSKKKFKDIYSEILAAGQTGQFDENALPSYTHSNKLMAWLFWQRIDIALQFLKQKKNLKILDFGCGGAVTFEYLKSLDSSIVGCDIDIELTKQVCSRLNINADLCTDLDGLADNSFDRIFALDVLEHIENVDPILRRFKNILKNDGQVILSGPTENIFYRLGRRLAGFSGHYHVKNVYQLEWALRDNGFICKKIRTLYYPIPLFRVSVWSC